MTQKIEIKITKEKIEDEITVDEFIAIQEGQIKTVKVVLAKFVWDSEAGDFMKLEKALGLVGSLTIGQLKDVIDKFRIGVTDNVVPN